MRGRVLAGQLLEESRPAEEAFLRLGCFRVEGEVLYVDTLGGRARQGRDRRFVLDPRPAGQLVPGSVARRAAEEQPDEAEQSKRRTQFHATLCDARQQRHRTPFLEARRSAEYLTQGSGL